MFCFLNATCSRSDESPIIQDIAGKDISAYTRRAGVVDFDDIRIDELTCTGSVVILDDISFDDIAANDISYDDMEIDGSFSDEGFGQEGGQLSSKG